MRGKKKKSKNNVQTQLIRNIYNVFMLHEGQLPTAYDEVLFVYLVKKKCVV